VTDPITCPFTVLIDTREQAPYSFRGLTANADKDYTPLIVDCRTATLPTGDYSIAGFENYITLERKSLSDAFNTFTHDRERWERELDRMRKIPACHVVIEASFDEIAQGPVKPGGANVGKAVMRSMASWSLDFPHVHFWAMGSRDMAEPWAFRILEKFWEKDQWQIKQLQKLSIEQSNTSSSRKKSRSS
jgi:ERCC4-type nuclease